MTYIYIHIYVYSGFTKLPRFWETTERSHEIRNKLKLFVSPQEINWGILCQVLNHSTIQKTCFLCASLMYRSEQGVSPWAGSLTSYHERGTIVGWISHAMAHFYTLEAKTPRKWSQRLSTHLFVRGKLTTSVVLVYLAALIRSVWRVKTYGFVQGEYFKHGTLGKYDCKLCFFFFFRGILRVFQWQVKGYLQGSPRFYCPQEKAI